MSNNLTMIYQDLFELFPNKVFYAHYVTSQVKMPYLIYQELNKKSSLYADDFYLYKTSVIQITLVMDKKDLQIEKRLEDGLTLKGIEYQMLSEYLGSDKTLHRIYEIKMEEFKDEQ